MSLRYAARFRRLDPPWTWAGRGRPRRRPSRSGRSPGTPPGYGRSMPDALVEKDGHVLTVTMNRPVRYNAMTLQMFARMADAWAAASEDPAIRVCILTGAGGNFSSGMDLRAMSGDIDP